MDADRFEALLRGLPACQLRAEQDAELIATLHAAAATSRDGWWRRPIPLWKCAAACGAAALLTASAMVAGPAAAPQRGGSADSADSKVRPALVRAHVDAALFASRPAAATQVDLRSWRILEPSKTGEMK